MSDMHSGFLNGEVLLLEGAPPPSVGFEFLSSILDRLGAPTASSANGINPDSSLGSTSSSLPSSTLVLALDFNERGPPGFFPFLTDVTFLGAPFTLIRFPPRSSMASTPRL